MASYYYHSTIRKYVILFGNMFNDITVKRFDANLNVSHTEIVPIGYGPSQKFLRRTEENPDTKRPIAIQLPRMAFQVTGLTFDPSRKISPVNKISVQNQNDPDKRTTVFVPIPYNISFTLDIMFKNIDDGMQIIEQILPYFRNHQSHSVELLPNMNLFLDIKTILNDVSLEDNFEGSYDEKRTIIWTLNFTMQGWFFGPYNISGVIKRAQVDFFIPPGSGEITDADVKDTPRIARNVTIPGLTTDGKPTTSPDNTIPYKDITSTDDYGYIEVYDEFNDGKKYDPVSGNDKNVKN